MGRREGLGPWIDYQATGARTLWQALGAAVVGRPPVIPIAFERSELPSIPTPPRIGASLADTMLEQDSAWWDLWL